MQRRPHILTRSSPDQTCFGERMRNVRHLACVQLGKHSHRLLAHRREAMAEPTELTAGECLEPASEGSHMDAIELGAVSLLQR